MNLPDRVRALAKAMLIIGEELSHDHMRDIRDFGVLLMDLSEETESCADVLALEHADMSNPQ